jgi:hypothetical protein
MTRTNNPRTAYTRKGQEVYLETWKVDGGWEAWVLNDAGYAVLVFVPGE